MTLFIPDHMYDTGVQNTMNTTIDMHLCSQLPTTHEEASSTFSLGSKTTVPRSTEDAPNPPGGRRVKVEAFNDGSISTGGTATHYAWVSSTPGWWVAQEIETPVAVTAGQSWGADIHYFTLADPADGSFLSDIVKNAGMNDIVVDMDDGEIHICNQLPLTFADVSNVSLGDQTLTQAPVIESDGAGGRRVRVQDALNIFALVSGEATHYAWTFPGNSELKLAQALAFPFTVQSGEIYTLSRHHLVYPLPA